MPAILPSSRCSSTGIEHLGVALLEFDMRWRRSALRYRDNPAGKCPCRSRVAHRPSPSFSSSGILGEAHLLRPAASREGSCATSASTYCEIMAVMHARSHSSATAGTDHRPIDAAIASRIDFVTSDSLGMPLSSGRSPMALARQLGGQTSSRSSRDMAAARQQLQNLGTRSASRFAAHSSARIE